MITAMHDVLTLGRQVTSEGQDVKAAFHEGDCRRPISHARLTLAS
jgi:hypothetical protein